MLLLAFFMIFHLESVAIKTVTLFNWGYKSNRSWVKSTTKQRSSDPYMEKFVCLSLHDIQITTVE